MPEPPTLADVYALIRKLPSDSLWQFWQELASCIGHEFLRAHFCGKAGETVTLYVSKRETSATLWFARGKGPPLGGRTHWLCAGYKVCFVEPEDVDIANDAPSLPRKRLAGESISLPVYIPRHHLPYFLYLQLHLCLF